MSEVNETGPCFRIFCERVGDTWVVHAGGEWLPAPLQPFFDHQLESAAVLLDFDYLGELARSRDASIVTRKTKNGSIALCATGPGSKILAQWLGSAMASSLLAPQR